MAIVPNKDGQGIKANGYYGDVDPSYCVPTTFAAGVPTGASAFTGEVRVNTTTGQMFYSLAKGSTQWVEKC